MNIFKKLFHRHKNHWIYCYEGTPETKKIDQEALFRVCEVCGKVEITWKVYE